MTVTEGDDDGIYHLLPLRIIAGQNVPQRLECGDAHALRFIA